MRTKALVVLSGGMDSATVLSTAIQNSREVIAITFDYNQRHKREILMAQRLCQDLDIQHKLIDMSFMSQLNLQSSLTSDKAVPEGHYEADSMKDTVVPGRNLMFSAIAASWAEAQNCTSIWLGVHAGDHHVYPDCRPEFISALKDVIKASTDGKIVVMAPYLNVKKADILRDGYEMGVDYAHTLTCYNGAELACGKCGSCQERLEAFTEIGKTDPVQYA